MFRDIRPGVVGIVVIVGLVIIFGSQYIVTHYYLEKPFKEEVLSIDGIKDVRVVSVEGAEKVYLTVDSKVDLKEAVTGVKELAQTMLNGQVVIDIDNSSSEEMKDLYDKIHFSIYEGIARGRFTQMVVEVKEIANSNEVDKLDIAVDSYNVYLTLIKDDEVYSKIIPRFSEQLTYGSINEAEGGESQW